MWDGCEVIFARGLEMPGNANLPSRIPSLDQLWPCLNHKILNGVAKFDWTCELRPFRDQLVTAPRLADETRRAYFASAPRL